MPEAEHNLTLAEACELVQAFRAKYPEETDELWSKGGELFDSILMGEAVEGLAKFKSWAELEWAGQVIRGRTEMVKKQKAFLDAVFRIVVLVVETAAEVAMKGA